MCFSLMIMQNENAITFKLTKCKQNSQTGLQVEFNQEAKNNGLKHIVV